MALFISFLLEDFSGEFGQFTGFQSGFGGFAETFAEQIFGDGELRLAAAVMAEFSNERAEALAAEDDAFAFQFLVGAFDGDDADEQILREHAERRQGDAGLEPALADLTLEPVNDLLVERAVRRRGD